MSDVECSALDKPLKLKLLAFKHILIASFEILCGGVERYKYGNGVTVQMLVFSLLDYY